MNTLQQNEELWQDLQPARGATPTLYFRLDAEGHLIITDTPGPIRLRVDAAGELIISDDSAKARGGMALVNEPAILMYKAL
jgi:hypothetical protein